MRLLIITIALSFSIWSIAYKMNQIDKKVDAQTESFCSYIAPIRKQEWKDTNWKDFDWYQSCVDNIRYANPMNRK